METSLIGQLSKIAFLIGIVCLSAYFLYSDERLTKERYADPMKAKSEKAKKQKKKKKRIVENLTEISKKSDDDIKDNASVINVEDIKDDKGRNNNKRDVVNESEEDERVAILTAKLKALAFTNVKSTPTLVKSRSKNTDMKSSDVDATEEYTFSSTPASAHQAKSDAPAQNEKQTAQLLNKNDAPTPNRLTQDLSIQKAQIESNEDQWRRAKNKDMILIPGMEWSVPQRRPPLCTVQHCDPCPLTDQTALIGTLLDDADDTQVGSIMPRFEFSATS
jgi:hypothetical protein